MNTTITPPTIDKLCLKYTDFRIQDYSKFTRHDTYDPQYGTSITKHYHNVPGFTLEARHDKQGTYSLFTTYNPNKAHTTHEKLLAGVGVGLNYTDGGVLRLDVCRDKQLSQNIRMYFPLFESAMGGRTTPARYEHSIRTGNRQGQLCFYDKSIEAKLPTPGICRLEVRYLKPGSIRKHGINTVSDLIQADLMQLYTTGGRLYLPNLSKLEISHETLSRAAIQLEFLYGNDPRPLDTFFAMGVLRELGVDGALEVIRITDITKQKKYNARRRVLALSKKIATLVSGSHPLRDEIQQYFAA